MYLQITSRCNMDCIHCGANCTTKGKDMPDSIVENALRWAENSEDYITIGGGEPTLHPKFKNILIDCIATTSAVHVITNGSVTREALLIARLIKKEVITGRLSNDVFHNQNMVDDEVYDAFDETGNAEFIEYKRGLCDCGRARKNIDIHGRPLLKECFCEELFVCPTGDVYTCGCKRIKLGNLSDYHAFCESYNSISVAVNEDEDASLHTCARYTDEGKRAYRQYKAMTK